MTTWLNTFPLANGVSASMSSAAIVLGRRNPDISRKTIHFGAYAMVHTKTTNNMKQRSTNAIALRASNNKDRYYFMSLYTGAEIHSNNWDPLPIDDYCINTVEKLAEDEEQPLLPDNMPLFEWAPG
eukprot:11883531-Ditylum_brightwellii.AAC.1